MNTQISGSRSDSGGGPLDARTIINFYRVDLEYRDQKALKSITFSVDNGEFLCLTGPSGAGKSTVGRAVADRLGLAPRIAYVAGDDLMPRIVDLADRADHRPDQLSGGQQQRVAIARALVHRPALVLADEPTGNLDQAAGEQVLGLMMSLAREEHSSLLLVTHSLAVARRADRILTLQEGRLSERGAELAW